MRVFFACFLTTPAAQLLKARTPSVTGLRPVPAENLHLTLHFLGSVAVERAAAVRELLALLPPERLTVGVREVTGFPRPDRARVMVARLTAHPRLREWQRLLSARWPTGETRAFDPHVTLARNRRPARLPALPDLSDLTLDLEPPGAYLSETPAGGARYRPFE